MLAIGAAGNKKGSIYEQQLQNGQAATRSIQTELF